MADESDSDREQIHDALQKCASADVTRPAVLTGWVVVCEWMDDEGERWLSKGYSSSLTAWHAKGMYHAALYDDWPDGEEEGS